MRQPLTVPILITVKGRRPASPTICDSKGTIMLDATTISSTIDTVNRAAAALGVSPNGDDGLTFIRREFNAETKGAHIFWSLENLRGRHAVVVDHSETFTHPASLIISIDPFTSTYHYHDSSIKSLRVSTPMSKHDIALMLQADNPIAVFFSMNADIAKFFADNNIKAKDVACCDYDSDNNETVVYMDYATITIKYAPEFEEVRYFYRFNLRGFLRRQRDFIKDAVTGCEEQAAKYQQLADAKAAQAAKFRKLMANLNTCV